MHWVRARLWPYLVVLFLVAGCSLLPSERAYQGWRPPSGGCHDGFANYLSEAVYDPKGCTEPHIYETFHVAEFGEDVAGQAKPPGSIVEAKAAWSVCDKELTAFLDGQWRDRKMEVRVGMPVSKAWEQGARWFSCEAASPKGFFTDMATMNRSFKGGYSTMPQLEWGCAHFTWQGHQNLFPCDQPHNAEFVGTLFSELTYAEVMPLLGDETGKVHEECRSAVAGFADVQYIYTGSWLVPPSEESWNAVDHGLRCFLWLLDLNVSKSLKGVGAAEWPIKGAATPV